MPQTNGFTVTTERLDEAANYIKDKTTQYDFDIKKLYSEVESLSSGSWKGVASDTFRAKVESYRGDFEELKNLLIQFADDLSIKSKNYIRTEESITNSIRNLK